MRRNVAMLVNSYSMPNHRTVALAPRFSALSKEDSLKLVNDYADQRDQAVVERAILLLQKYGDKRQTQIDAFKPTSPPTRSWFPSLFGEKKQGPEEGVPIGSLEETTGMATNLYRPSPVMNPSLSYQAIRFLERLNLINITTSSNEFGDGRWLDTVYLTKEGLGMLEKLKADAPVKA